MARNSIRTDNVECGSPCRNPGLLYSSRRQSARYLGYASCVGWGGDRIGRCNDLCAADGEMDGGCHCGRRRGWSYTRRDGFAQSKIHHPDGWCWKRGPLDCGTRGCAPGFPFGFGCAVCRIGRGDPLSVASNASDPPSLSKRAPGKPNLAKTQELYAFVDSRRPNFSGAQSRVMAIPPAAPSTNNVSGPSFSLILLAPSGTA